MLMTRRQYITICFQKITLPEQTIMHSHDDDLIVYRNAQYDPLKKVCRFAQIHALGKCNCKKTGKICDWNLPEFQSYKEAYIESPEKGDTLVKENWGFFQTMYNLGLSVKNSNSSQTGNVFEKGIEQCFVNAGLHRGTHYATQVCTDHSGHICESKKKGDRMDFLIPAPQKDDYGTLLSEFVSKRDGIIVSAKTTTRERVKQDKHYGKFTLITLDKKFEADDPNITLVRVQENGYELTHFIHSLCERFFASYAK